MYSGRISHCIYLNSVVTPTYRIGLHSNFCWILTCYCSWLHFNQGNIGAISEMVLGCRKCSRLHCIRWIIIICPLGICITVSLRLQNTVPFVCFLLIYISKYFYLLTYSCTCMSSNVKYFSHWNAAKYIQCLLTLKVHFEWVIRR